MLRLRRLHIAYRYCAMIMLLIATLMPNAAAGAIRYMFIFIAATLLLLMLTLIFRQRRRHYARRDYARYAMMFYAFDTDAACCLRCRQRYACAPLRFFVIFFTSASLPMPLLYAIIDDISAALSPYVSPRYDIIAYAQ